MPTQTKRLDGMRDSIVFNIKPMACPRTTVHSFWNEQSKRYAKYKQEIQWVMRSNLFVPGDQLDIKFYIPFPKSWPQKKKDSMRLRPHQSAPDIDNLVKGIMDSIFENKGGDHIVHEIHATKKWAHEGYIEVTNLKQGGKG